MAMDSTVSAVTRKTKGGKAGRRLRRAGVLPAVVYGAGREGTLVEVNEHAFEQMMKHHASEHLMVDLSIDGRDPVKVLVKEVQHHAVTHSVMHVDFQEVSMLEKLRVQVAVELCGEPEGVSLQGGILEHLLREVEVECLPGDIPEVLEADVSALKVGDRLAAGDIPLDASKFKLVTEPGIAVAAVVPSRVQAASSEAEDETGGETTAEEASTGAS